MSSKNANIKEKLKQALNSTFKVISDDFQIQNKFDKIFPYKKYYIDKKHIPLNLEKLINDYNNLKK